MLASTILTPSKLNPPHFVPPVAVAETHPRNRVAIFPKSNSKLAFVARASGNVRDGGAVDATSPPNNNSDSEFDQQSKPPISVPKPLPRRNRVLRNGPPKPSVMQIERIVGAGSFRDTEPPPLRDSDMRKTVMDLFLGQAMEGEVQKKMREAGEWLSTNAEPRITSSRKGILMFMLQWILPVWGILLLVAFGAIKLPFSNPFLDDLLM